MRCKKSIALILSIFFIIVLMGFLKVSNSISNSIKKSSSFKVYMDKNPFNIEIQLSKYTFCLNKEVAINTKERIINSSVVEKIKENKRIHDINKEIIFTFNNNVFKIDKALRLMNK